MEALFVFLFIFSPSTLFHCHCHVSPLSKTPKQVIKQVIF